jgi:opacity protein-like surface antigen
MRIVTALIAALLAGSASAQAIYGPVIPVPVTPSFGGSGVANTGTLTWNAAQTFSFTSGQTMTFPSASATLAGTNTTNTWSVGQTFTNAVTIGSGASLRAGSGSPVIISYTAPTLSSCGGSAAITNNSGTAAFNYSVGTSPPTTCTVTLPAASHGWHCTADDLTTLTEVIHQTGVSTTTCVLTYYAITTGVATAPTASDNILVSAMGY